jgi:hypothetical protein
MYTGTTTDQVSKTTGKEDICSLATETPTLVENQASPMRFADPTTVHHGSSQGNQHDIRCADKIQSNYFLRIKRRPMA